MRSLAALALGAGTGGVVAALRDPDTDPGAVAQTTTSTRRPPTTTAAADPPTTTSAPAAATAALLCREAWGARPPAGRAGTHEVARIMVHHTAVALHDSRRGPERLRAHQAHHQQQGFGDLAYHLVVGGHGHVFEGRDPSRPGETFTDYDPRGWLLVTCEGNFDEQPLPDEQLEGLADVLAWATERFGVGVDAIAPHSEVSATACPGDALIARFRDGSLRGRVERRLEAGGVRLERVCGPEAASVVEAIEAGRA